MRACVHVCLRVYMHKLCSAPPGQPPGKSLCAAAVWVLVIERTIQPYQKKDPQKLSDFNSSAINLQRSDAKLNPGSSHHHLISHFSWLAVRELLPLLLLFCLARDCINSLQMNGQNSFITDLQSHLVVLLQGFGARGGIQPSYHGNYPGRSDAPSRAMAPTFLSEDRRFTIICLPHLLSPCAFASLVHWFHCSPPLRHTGRWSSVRCRWWLGKERRFPGPLLNYKTRMLAGS